MTKSEPYDPEEYIPPANLSASFDCDVKADIVPSNEVELLFISCFCTVLSIFVPDYGFLVLRQFSTCIVYYLCVCINNR